MSNKLFVGSLSWNTTDDTLRALFETIGKVVSAKVIMDKYTGKSRGFGFVEMENEEKAKEAIEKLNGQDLDGRNIIVNEARDQEPRQGGDYNRGN
jgi:cold-inducible RNA-binding protein